MELVFLAVVSDRLLASHYLSSPLVQTTFLHLPLFTAKPGSEVRMEGEREREHMLGLRDFYYYFFNV